MASRGFVSKHVASHHIAPRRFWMVGLLTVLAAVVANFMVDALALNIFHISAAFLPLQLAGVVLSTAVGVAGAVLVFALVSRYTKRPIRTFWMIAIFVLAVSFIPIVALLLNPGSIAGTTTLAAVVLMALHLVAASITLGSLTAFVPEKYVQPSF
ncbi:MAG: hypothetical protein H0W02_04365 [Ktedonobacteraceae bacterium]|nr:hypothetical protein [Ktedonobacteraceae bacterium]